MKAGWTELCYKTVNIYKFSKHFSETHYIPFLEAYVKALGNNEYYEQVRLVQTRFGGYWRYPSLLDFSYLVNPYYPPQSLIYEIKASFETLLTDITKVLLIKHNILVKDLSSKIENGQYMRIAIRNKEDNNKLLKALRKELQTR